MVRQAHHERINLSLPKEVAVKPFMVRQAHHERINPCHERLKVISNNEPTKRIVHEKHERHERILLLFVLFVSFVDSIFAYGSDS